MIAWEQQENPAETEFHGSIQPDGARALEGAWNEGILLPAHVLLYSTSGTQAKYQQR